MWKKFYGLRGGDKESGRQRALLTFPAGHALLARKRDHGRSEAALLALYGASWIVLTGVPPRTKITEFAEITV
jgi:hypothetical protein